MGDPLRRPVHRAIHKPLTAGGRFTPAVDRRLFFVGGVAGMMTLDLSGSFVVGLTVFALLYALAWVTVTRDPQLVAAVARSLWLGRHYDAWTHAPFDVTIR